MARVTVNKSKITAIADAIREKNSESDTYTLDDMPTKIGDISTGVVNLGASPYVIVGKQTTIPIEAYCITKNGFNDNTVEGNYGAKPPSNIRFEEYEQKYFYTNQIVFLPKDLERQAPFAVSESQALGLPYRDNDGVGVDGYEGLNQTTYSYTNYRELQLGIGFGIADGNEKGTIFKIPLYSKKATTISIIPTFQQNTRSRSWRVNVGEPAITDYAVYTWIEDEVEHQKEIPYREYAYNGHRLSNYVASYNDIQIPVGASELWVQIDNNYVYYTWIESFRIVTSEPVLRDVTREDLYVGRYACANLGMDLANLPTDRNLYLGDYAFAYNGWDLDNQNTGWNKIDRAQIAHLDLSNAIKIGDGCFRSGNLQIKKLTLGNGLKYIGADAFRENKIEEIYINSNNITDNDSEYVFGNKAYLKKFIIGNNVTTVPRHSIQDADNLEELEWGGLLDIPNNFAQNNDSSILATVTLPSSIRSIGEYAFASCTKIVTFDASSTSITTLSYRCMQSCTALETLRLNEGLTTIASQSVRNCSSLTDAYIPSTITAIANDSFSNSNLSNCTFHINMTQADFTALGLAWNWSSSGATFIFTDSE